jgi:electron transfer flavoprotein-quinone oxidoreductase
LAGKAAAETAIEAHKKGDFSSKSLSSYRARLDERFIMGDLHQYRNLSFFLRTHPEFMDVYPAFINEALGSFFSGFGQPKKQLYKDIMRSLTYRRPLFKAMGDIVAFGRAIIGV